MHALPADPWDPVKPAFLHLPSWDYTLGAEVADLCALLNFGPDPEQEIFLDAVFGVRSSDGMPACEEATEIAGRQNLKTGEFIQTAFGWMFITKEERVLWSAHEFGTSRDSFLLMRALLESKPWSNRLVRQYYASASFMGIVLTDGRMLEFAARTTNQGRGKSAPKAIWDEGLELRPEHLGAQDAVKSTFPWAQTCIGSSACKSYSDVLRAKVDKLRAGTMGPREFGREFADDLPGECAAGEECTHTYGTPGCRLDDPARWKRANPSLGRVRPSGRGLTVGAIERERRNQPNPLIFARERHGWHDEAAAELAVVVDAETWRRRIDPGSLIVTDLVLVLEVAADRSWSSVVAVGRNAEGLIHAEVTSTQPDPGGLRLYDHRASTTWVLPRFRDLMADVGTDVPVLIRKRSAAKSLAPDLEKLGVRVEWLPDEDYPSACGHLVDLVAGEQIVHVGDPELTAAVLMLRKKFIADRVFIWGKAAGDISPAVAMTAGAYWLHTQSQASVYEERGPLWF